jgi:hypothetical protein
MQVFQRSNTLQRWVSVEQMIHSDHVESFVIRVQATAEEQPLSILSRN